LQNIRMNIRYEGCRFYLNNAIGGCHKHKVRVCQTRVVAVT
jgi:hypothetical protein